mgnify:CR=1 FL=1
MDAVTITLVAIVAITLTFGFANGFRDANGTIATSVSTHALTPHIALAMATSMNLLGALISTGVAQTVGAEIIATPSGSAGMAAILAAVVGATLWNLLTWRLGLPSSSSYALIGGLIGAAVAATTGVHWDGVATKVLLPMVLSPLIAFTIAIAVHTGIMWLFRGSRRVSALNRGFRLAQTFSTAGVALGHGLQDAQKTMGVIVLALVSIGYQDSFDVPLWVILSVAAAMAAGTYAGGWRFLRTPSRGVVQLDAPRAFAGEATAASVLYVTAAAGVPVSAMQAMTSGVVGAATTRGRAAVRWGVLRTMFVAWAFTLPGAATAAALVFTLTDLALPSI